MLFIKRNQLTIVEWNKREESISIETVRGVLEDSHSNMIYFEESSGKLVGVISTGDVSRAYDKGLGRICINREFTWLYVGEYEKAKAVFKEKTAINAIPVLTREKILMGEYTRWDEILILDYELSVIKEGDIWACNKKDKIALVRPKGNLLKKNAIYQAAKAYFDRQGISVTCIDYLELVSYADKVDKFLFVDENEIRACTTLLNIIMGKDYAGRDKMGTYFSFRVNAEQYLYDKCAMYLQELCDRGVNIVAMVIDVNPYYMQLIKRNLEKFEMVVEDFNYILPKCAYKEFFDDLYSEGYADEIMQMPIMTETDGGKLRLKDSHSQYYNVTNGERLTVDQPKNFDRSIYFVGPCYIYGHFVEDKNTIESILQKRLCEEGNAVRCVNYGAVGMYLGYNCLPRIAAIPLREGDIVVIDRPPCGIEGVKYLDVTSIMEKHDVNLAWMTDNPLHCNHKINELYADAIHEVIQPILTKEEPGKLVEKEENYINLLYLQRYFAGCDFQQYHRIGSIVMNCNPFTYGHRYLIEKALESADFLIIFVVEEDKSSFSFTERVSMVKEGVADLSNVMVVPSGPFILTQMSFPEYFVKEKSEDLNRHTEQDIMTFAEKIAPQLGISCRFVGEEAEDEVTEQYNMAMKKILPQYGIELIEIPRKTINGKPISASLVREYIEKGSIDRLAELVPATTGAFLGMA